MSRHYGISRASVVTQAYQTPENLEDIAPLGFFDERVPPPVDALFKERAATFANTLYPNVEGDATPTELSCEEAYNLVHEWFDFLNIIVVDVEQKARVVNQSPQRTDLQSQFNQILSSYQGPYNSLKNVTAPLPLAINTYGLGTMYDIISSVYGLFSLGFADDYAMSPEYVLPFIKDILSSLSDFEEAADHLEGALKDSLELPTVGLKAVLPSIGDLIAPSAYGSNSQDDFCILGIEALAERTLIPADFHNALGVVNYSLPAGYGAARYSWPAIADGQAATQELDSNAPWLTIESAAQPLINSLDGWTDGDSLMQGTGLVIAAIIESLGRPEEDPEGWWDTIVAWVDELWEWGVALFSLMGGDFTQIIAQVAEEISSALAENMVDIEMAHQIIEQALFSPSAENSSLVQALTTLGTSNYTPHAGGVWQYIIYRTQQMTQTASQLQTQANMYTQTFNPGVPLAVKILAACCYYNQSVYFYKNGGPSSDRGDVDGYEKYKQWYTERQQMVEITSRAKAQYDILRESPAALIRQAVQEDFGPLQRVHEQLPQQIQEIASGAYLQDIAQSGRYDYQPVIRQGMMDTQLSLPSEGQWEGSYLPQQVGLDSLSEPTMVATESPFRRLGPLSHMPLGGILPLKPENMYAVVLGGLALVAYLHLREKRTV